MIGQKRGTVSLIHYKEEWSEIFHKDKNMILQILGNNIVDIQHVGSTAIPGISAKPIIDILVGLKNIFETESFISKLEEKNYKYRPNASTKDRLFFIKGTEDFRTHHLHVVQHDSNEWNRMIHFRDYLRENVNVALEYNKLKEELAVKFPNNREEYTKGKEDFVKQIEKLF
ncbi:GrpB family protein [Mangrovibacillus cuniculi]|uniref:GrpB family protein n=1 Tax=Mangrovibacillus cuniculi TaxID=2593652 RepID=A0A7S8CBK6_9BACI|nr:GrpB family protein [Mangrovibacillus cuniculi]QPC46966.1 GrpB family protein [Mangrovibacillus cuniculi]